LVHAHALNKKVWIFKAGDNVVRDRPIAELDASGAASPAGDNDAWQQQCRIQQAKYLEHLRKLNLLRHPFDSPEDLEKKVLLIQDEMSTLRDEFKQWMQRIEQSMMAIEQSSGGSPGVQAPAEPDPLGAMPEGALINGWSERLIAPDRAMQFRGQWCETLVSSLRIRYEQFPADCADAVGVVQWFSECPIEQVEGLFSSIRLANKSVGVMDGESRKWALDFIVLAALRCLSPSRISGFGKAASDGHSGTATVGHIATSSALIASIGVAGLLGQALIIEGSETPKHVMVVDNIEPLLEADEAVLRQLYDKLPLSARMSRTNQSLAALHRSNPSDPLTEDEKGDLWSYFRECFLDGHFAAVFLRVSVQPGTRHQMLAEKIASAIDATVIQGAVQHDQQLVIQETRFDAGRLRSEIKKRLAELGSGSSPAIDDGRGKDTLDVQSSQSTASNSIAASDSGGFPVMTVDQHPLDGFLNGHELHLFISHASEDKTTFVIPLVTELQRRGVRVWLDQNELFAGESISRAIDSGLRKARFGVAILSPAYLQKEWTRAELEALLHRQIEERTLRLVPVLLGLDAQVLRQYSHLLSSRLWLDASNGVDQVAEGIVNVIRGRV